MEFPQFGLDFTSAVMGEHGPRLGNQGHGLEGRFGH